MIKRRTFLKSVIGLATTSLAMKGFASVPPAPAGPSPTDAGVAANFGSIVFTIQGWDGDGPSAVEADGRQIVPIYLPGSWRSSWM